VADLGYLISIASGLGILLIGGLMVERCDFAPYGVATIVAITVSSASTGIVTASRRASPVTAFGHALLAAALIAAAAFVGHWMIFGAQSCGE
jgi:hypothetical protein